MTALDELEVALTTKCHRNQLRHCRRLGGIAQGEYNVQVALNNRGVWRRLWDFLRKDIS